MGIPIGMAQYQELAKCELLWPEGERGGPALPEMAIASTMEAVSPKLISEACGHCQSCNDER